MSISPALGEEREVELTAGSIRYRERGEGPPIVFVHGVVVNGDLWRRVVPLLAEDFRCITPDWPKGSHSLPMRENADLSPPGLAELIAEFMDRLDLDDVTLVGNDTGGAVCQLVAVTHPERLARLVLTSCDAFDRFPPPPFQFLRWAGMIPGVLAAMSVLARSELFLRSPIGYGRVVTRMPERGILDSWIMPGRRREIRRDAARLFRAISPRQTSWAADRLAEFQRPVLIAWGADDRLFPVALGRRLADRVPDCQFELVDNARTFVPEDNPKQLAELMERFIART